MENTDVFLIILMELLLSILMLLVCTNSTHLTLLKVAVLKSLHIFISLASAYITSSSGVVTANVGSDVTLEITAIGDPEDITYVWKKIGVIIPGETSNTLTLTDVSVDDIGQYECIPSNSLGSHNSSIIQLDVECEF